MSRRAERARKPDEPAAGGGRWHRPRVNVTVQQGAVYVAAGLIYATIHFLFTGLPIDAVPINAHVALAVQPASVVPVFMGLTAGPLGGLLVGLGGRLLGDLLAGKGVDGFGLMFSGVLGLAAGLAYGRLTGYRTLRQVLVAFAFGLLACAAASLASVLLLQTILWRELNLMEGLYHTLSQFLSSGIMVVLLISTPLWVWGRTQKSEVRGQRSEGGSPTSDL